MSVTCETEIELVEVKESIISMLLKIHAKVAGTKSAFLLPSPLPDKAQNPIPMTCKSMIEKVLIAAAVKSQTVEKVSKW